MAIRAEYVVEKLPDSFVTKAVHYEFIGDGEDRKGKKLMKMVSKEVESRGGWLFTFFNGSSIRLESLDQMPTFGLSPKPRLIDDQTGEEVDESGIPLSLKDVIAKATAIPREAGAVVSKGEGVESSIANLE